MQNCMVFFSPKRRQSYHRQLPLRLTSTKTSTTPISTCKHNTEYISFFITTEPKPEVVRYEYKSKSAQLIQSRRFFNKSTERMCSCANRNAKIVVFDDLCLLRAELQQCRLNGGKLLYSACDSVDFEDRRVHLAGQII